MTMTRAQPTLRTLPRREMGTTRTEVDAAQLGDSLRELALEAHRLVRAENRLEHESELADVHSRIVQLERRLDEQDLYSLASYVSALRQRVEEHLA